jgi:signal transduction histidine kinase/ligand-binding sensor domain-containing protein/DNA-binding response OmpR family regulator
MAQRYRPVLLVFILLSCTNYVFPQDREYICDHFNISNGLISDNIYKVFMDSEGYTWILTYNGLEKYNGYKFESYTSKPGVPGTLSSNFVVDIFEDRKGSLIIVLEDGIDIYDKHTDKFTNILSDLPFAEAKRNEISRQSSVAEDKSGFIWATCNNHLVRIDSTKQNFLVYQNEFNGNFVLNADSTVLWIITDHVLKRFDLDNNLLSSINVSDIPGPVAINRLNIIFFDSYGICWLGTSEGLFQYDEKKNRIIDPGYRFHSNLSSKPEENITAIYEDYKKDLWIASGSCVFKINRASGDIEVLQHETDNQNTILDGQISGIFGNNSGIIWITYLNDGFTRINIRTRNFRSYKFKSGGNEGLGGKTVRSVYKDRKGYIWVGLYNSGLDRINTATGEIKHYKHTNENSINSNYISSLFVDAKNRLWVGSHDNGLCYADDIYSDVLNFKRPDFLNSNDEIYHILADSLNRIWFGTRTGLGMYNYQSDKFLWVLEDHNIQSFIFDKNIIWIASWNYGLCKLSFTADRLYSPNPAYDTLSSILYGAIKTTEKPVKLKSPEGIHRCISIYQDSDSDLWIGTYDKGLVQVTQNQNGFKYIQYDKTRGAPGNAVYGVTGDRNGYIWISTDQGIGKFDPSGQKFLNYYRKDGLLSDYFMWKAYYQAPDGELLFGSVDGLNYFYPEEIYDEPLQLRLLISELRVQNRDVECGDTINGELILNKQIIYQDTIVLNYRNGNFSFEFFATGSVNPDRIIYAHMLLGFDKDWIIHNNLNRIASYNILTPGTYYFRVRATENEGSWTDKFVEKVVIVLPPWWKTNIAYAAYILLILGLILLISQSLIRFLALKHDLIYNEKLHQSKLVFFTNISHELKTPLSLIKAPLNDILQDKKLSHHNRKNLQVAKQNADNLFNLVNELLEFRRTDAGISKLRSENINLTELLREITSQFEYIANEKGIPFLVNIPDEKLRIWVDREKFRKIINNLLGNAFNYTQNGGTVMFSVIRNPGNFRFNEEYHTLQLSQLQKGIEYIGLLVTDSGVGISKESLPKIFDRFYQIEAEQASEHIGSGIGLALVKNLVLMHYGNIQVASERRKGTEILISLPLGDSHLKNEEKITSPLHSQSENRQSGEINEDPKKILGNNFHSKNQPIPKILIVEDNRDLRNYLKENLSKNFRVTEVSNGAEGMEKLKDEVPDLIITDWIMPTMDGTEFIRRIRSEKTTSTIPIILLTAKDELKDKQEAIDIGTDLIITKPFNLQLLLLQANRIIVNNQIRMREYGIGKKEIIAKVKDDMEFQFIRKIEEFIYKNISNQQLNAELIADSLTISRTTLYSRTREITGITLGEYIQKIRMQYALNLMIYENRSVAEVYTMVGISSSSYFIRLFRKYYNATPKEYIRNTLNNPLQQPEL